MVHCLDHYEYHDIFYSKEIQSISTYGKRAIFVLRNRDLVEEYPELGSDQEDDMEMHEL